MSYACAVDSVPAVPGLDTSASRVDSGDALTTMSRKPPLCHHDCCRSHVGGGGADDGYM